MTGSEAAQTAPCKQSLDTKIHVTEMTLLNHSFRERDRSGGLRITILRDLSTVLSRGVCPLPRQLGSLQLSAVIAVQDFALCIGRASDYQIEHESCILPHAPWAGVQRHGMFLLGNATTYAGASGHESWTGLTCCFAELPDHCTFLDTL